MDDLCLHSSNVKSIFNTLLELIKSGKRYRLVIKEWRDKRTVDQNSLNWMWCTEIAEKANAVSDELITPEDVHELYKELYCPVKIKIVLGVKVKVKSTKLLDTGEMHFYLNQMEYDARSKGLNLTIPNNSEYQKLKDKQVT